ncbi:MAG: transporter substrate-binding domain-containing protein, partial [Thermodesulfobacteriota bacterium]|nr:transporter substrate-binding domain-containing protein [Thermodesulfobacteriota bacterium]
LAENPGVTVEVLQLVGQRLDLDITFIRQPWKRCLVSLQEGSADLLFTASYKEKRKKFGLYPMKNGEVDESRRITNTTYSFYVPKGTTIPWDGKTLGDLNGPVGAPAGYSIVEDLKKLGAKVDESPATLNDFQKLNAGRLAAVAALEGAGDFELRKHPNLATTIEKINPPIKTKAYYVMISHQFNAKNPELAQKIWNEIAKIRDSKEMPAIMDKYYK